MDLVHYADRRQLSYREAIDEPNWFVSLSFMVWNMDAQRDKLKEKETT